MKPADRAQTTRFPTWLVPFCLLLLTIPLFVTPVLPLIDFYNHVARFFIFSDGSGHPDFARNYLVNWRLVPNLGLDAIGMAVMQIASPLIGAKLIVALILFVQFFGLLALNRVLGARNGVATALLGTAVLFSYILNWGFANFLLATGLGFWGVAAWLRLRDRPVIAILSGVVIGPIIFLAHGFGFMLYGIIIAAIEFGRWRAAGEKLPTLAVGLAGLAAQAVLPAIMFILSSTAQTKASAVPVDKLMAHLSGSTLRNRIMAEAYHRVETIMRVAESPYAAFDIALFIVVSVGLGFAILRKHLTIVPAIRPALLLLVLFTVLTPPAMFGVGFVSDRVPYVLALLFIAGLDGPALTAPLIKFGLVAVALVRTCAVSLGWHGYADDYRMAQTLFDKVPKGALVMTHMVKTGDRRDGNLKRCQMYAPLNVAMRGIIVPLFADPTMQPLSLVGPIKSAITNSQGPRTWDWNKTRANDEAAIARVINKREFQYLFICGAERLRTPLPPVESTQKAGRFVLLKLR